MLKEILENAPIGLELYSTIVGRCAFQGLKGDNVMYSPIHNIKDVRTVMDNGKAYTTGEPVMFPSLDHSWDKWQPVLFPKSVGSVVVSSYHGCNDDLFLITSKTNAFRVSEGNVGYVNLSEIANDKARYATPEQKEVFDSLLEEKGFVKTDCGGHIEIWHDFSSDFKINDDEPTFHIDEFGGEKVPHPIIVDRDYMRGMVKIEGLDTVQYNTIFSIIKTWSKT